MTQKSKLITPQMVLLVLICIAGVPMLSIGTPFLLDSWWALIPVGIVLVLIIIRTALEDKTLQKKLEDNKEYSQKVPYRLFPGIWWGIVKA